MKAREQKGSFINLDDFFERIPTREVGAGCVETLIRAGAFDCLDDRRPNLLRSQLPSVLPRAYSRDSRNKTIAAEASSGFSTISRQRISRAREMAETAIPPSRHSFRKCRRFPMPICWPAKRKRLAFISPATPLPGMPDCCSARDPLRGRFAVARGEIRRDLGRNDHERQRTERAEEPIRAHQDGETYLRGSQRYGPCHALAGGIRQNG